MERRATNTSSMAKANMLTEAYTSTPARATCRWRDTWLLPHRGIKDKLTPYLRALQLQKRVRRKPGDEALQIILETVL